MEIDICGFYELDQKRRNITVFPREGFFPPIASQLPLSLGKWRRHRARWLQPEYGATSLFNTIIDDQTSTVPKLKWPDNLLPLLGLFLLLLLLNPCNATGFGRVNLKGAHMGDR